MLGSEWIREYGVRRYKGIWEPALANTIRIITSQNSICDNNSFLCTIVKSPLPSPRPWLSSRDCFGYCHMLFAGHASIETEVPQMTEPFSLITSSFLDPRYTSSLVSIHYALFDARGSFCIQSQPRPHSIQAMLQRLGSMLEHAFQIYIYFVQTVSDQYALPPSSIQANERRP